MELSEKTTELRKANGIAQEELAEKCNVSRPYRNGKRILHCRKLGITEKEMKWSE